MILSFCLRLTKISHNIFLQYTTQTQKSLFKAFQDIFSNSGLFKALKTVLLNSRLFKGFKACASPDYVSSGSLRICVNLSGCAIR